MKRYYPIESGAPWNDADHADLRGFDWRTKTAEFSIWNDNRIVEVSFPDSVIVRMLDEFPLGTEDGLEDREGLVPHHFAYRVEGDPFLNAQSETWRDVFGPVQHYRFITGAGCLDVVANGVPHFTIVTSEVR
jgi:hypothetical protein